MPKPLTTQAKYKAIRDLIADKKNVKCSNPDCYYLDGEIDCQEKWMLKLDRKKGRMPPQCPECGYIGCVEEITPPDLTRVLWWDMKIIDKEFYKKEPIEEVKRRYVQGALKILSKWDISKPLLRDQSDEVIEFLFEIIFKVKEMKESISVSL